MSATNHSTATTSQTTGGISMTLAINKLSDKVIGQVCDIRYDQDELTLLTASGYVTIPASSVRLEVVR